MVRNLQVRRIIIQIAEHCIQERLVRSVGRTQPLSRKTGPIWIQRLTLPIRRPRVAEGYWETRGGATADLPLVPRSSSSASSL
eukprot:9113072-Pyramimonas_sp.AAC.1